MTEALKDKCHMINGDTSMTHDHTTDHDECHTKRIKRLEYKGKLILAPMVKVGSLPMRLLALQYGADIVYSEEIIDFKLLNSIRIENKLLGTIDFIDKTDNTLVFRTCAKEKGHLVLQIGTSDGDRAAKVGKMMEQDIDGIDINMGCPKPFSLKGGMGAALLSQPDKVVDILTKLKAAVSIPVTCKIIIFPDVSKTIELVKIIEKTGVAAVGVHGRTKDQRPNDPNNVDAINQIVDSVSVPIIANGGSSNNRNSPMNTYHGIQQFWKESKASSVMIARAAEWNVSVFKESEKLVDIMTVIQEYMYLAIHFDYPECIVKYCVQQMLGSRQTDTEQGKQFLETATMADMCKVLNLEPRYRERQKELGRDALPDHVFSALPVTYKPLVEGLSVVEKFCPFIRAHYGDDNCVNLPKSRLLDYTRLKELEKPLYKVYQEDKKFRAIVDVDGACFSSLSWEKNKRYAEQAAAIVANLNLGIFTPEEKTTLILENKINVNNNSDVIVNNKNR